MKRTPNVGTVAYIKLPTFSLNQNEEVLLDTAKHENNMKGTNILIVDDDEMVLEVMKELLQSFEINVTIVNSGRQALQFFQDSNTSFDLVMLDMIMGEMDGRETFIKIRAHKETQSILIYSGFAPDEKISALLKTGNCCFIKKPYERAELQAAISKTIKRQRVP